MKPPAPPRIKAVESYWTEPPPELSDRAKWWLRRIANGWKRNRRISALGYHCSAEYFGVYIWEWLHILSPALQPIPPGAEAIHHTSATHAPKGETSR